MTEQTAVRVSILSDFNHQFAHNMHETKIRAIIDILDNMWGVPATNCGGEFSEDCDVCATYFVCKRDAGVAKMISQLKEIGQ